MNEGLKLKAEEYVEIRGKELFRKFYDNELSMADLLKTCCTEFSTEATKELKETYKKQRNKRIDELQKKNHELEAQIEKMKCCGNCNNWNWKHSKCEKKLKGDCFKASKWVMRNF